MRRERKEDRRNIAAVRITATVISPSHRRPTGPTVVSAVYRVAHSRFVDSLNIVKSIKPPSETQFAGDIYFGSNWRFSQSHIISL